MKKLDKSIAANLDAFVIYEQELRDLVALLNENCTGIKLQVDNLEFDNVDELINNFAPNRIKELKISAFKPHIDIELNALWARIYAESSAPAVEGLYYKCIRILQRRSKIYGLLCSYRIFWALMVIQFLFSTITKGPWSPYLTALFFTYFGWTMFVRMTRHSLIYARKADSFESFFIRNKDKLILDAIIGLVGVIVGIAIKTYILKS